MEPEPAPLIGIHPEKLTTLCDVMNRGPLMFEFRAANRAIVARYLKPDEHGTGYALVMPLIISSHEEVTKDREQAQEQANKAYQKAKDVKERTEGTTA
jgi:hypothetical protein